MREALFLLLALGAVGGLWSWSASGRERVLAVVKEVCGDLGLQRLDDSVVLSGLRLLRSARGWRVGRIYRFEFTLDGTARYEGDAFGSRLWLLERAKLTAETIRLARSYAEEALAWLVEDGIAEAVAVEVHRQGRGGLGIGVTITRGTGTLAPEDLRFSFLWELA